MGQGAVYASATIIDKGMTSMQLIRLRYQFYLPLYDTVLALIA